MEGRDRKRAVARNRRNPDEFAVVGDWVNRVLFYWSSGGNQGERSVSTSGIGSDRRSRATRPVSVRAGPAAPRPERMFAYSKARLLYAAQSDRGNLTAKLLLK